MKIIETLYVEAGTADEFKAVACSGLPAKIPPLPRRRMPELIRRLLIGGLVRGAPVVVMRSAAPSLTSSGGAAEIDAACVDKIMMLFQPPCSLILLAWLT